MSIVTATNYTKLDSNNIEIELITTETTERTRADIIAEAAALHTEQDEVDLTYSNRQSELTAMIVILDTP